MTDQAEKRASIAQWEALLARYPPGSPLEQLWQLGVVLAANGTTLHLLVTRRMRPWELVALVALEAAVLTSIAWVQTRGLPESALMDKPQPLRQRLGVLAFGLFWLGCVYAIVLGVWLDTGALIALAVRQPLAALRRSGLYWPLAITLGGAVADAVRDRLHWRERGGYFLSTPGFNAGARWLTLFLGGIPFLVPIAAVGWGLVTLVERLAGRRRGKAPPSGAAIVLMPLLGVGIFGVMGWLLSAGVSGWAVGYCSAKLVSELLIACLPLIASKARAEETAALRGRR
jgi:hypothetical protein